MQSSPLPEPRIAMARARVSPGAVKCLVCQLFLAVVDVVGSCGRSRADDPEHLHFPIVARTRGYAGRLEEGLERIFGADSAFRDVSDLLPGQAYPLVLERRIRSSVAVLVVIGPRWLEASRDGVRRLDEADDLVCKGDQRVALGSGKPVIPVLVAGATMPDEAHCHCLCARSPGCMRSRSRTRAGATVWLDSARRSRPCWRRATLQAQALERAACRICVRLRGCRLRLLAPRAGRARAGRKLAGRCQLRLGRHARGNVQFERLGGRWEGTASYLGIPRAMESLRVDGHDIHF